MQLTNLTSNVRDNFVYATFVGNISKLKATESLELSFQRIGGEYVPEKSGSSGSVWKFPAYVSSRILQEIIRNTCFECGGLMRDGISLDNTRITHIDFPGQTDLRGCTETKDGHHVVKNVRKCTNCGHSHT